MSQEDLVQSLTRLNHRRRGSNRIVVASLAVSAGLAVAGAAVQQTRSDNNERQQETRRDDQRQASGKTSKSN